MKTFMGIAASNGIAIAPAFRLTGLNLSVKKRSIEDPTAEIKRLHAAIDVSKDELLIIKRKALKDLSHPVAEVFQAHIAILADPVFLEKKLN
ncbi:phosphoenolpyruvate-utilizing N-terminal domain-containing protein [Lentilactobacillus kisonensis]|uniref:phosphoenolpyruvate-utilizing N-terminal domain-containing protein n=1 Tax=Lentilactobacillus kisonensis TaxID=481722 RepID=UPI000AB78641|nr:phosphoenolpyruvate-utilizing N-terminal domain-containing protein [Lentilactobacillus kisonensis]